MTKLNKAFFQMEEVEIPITSSDNFCDSMMYLEFVNKWDHILGESEHLTIHSPKEIAAMIEDHKLNCLAWMVVNKESNVWREGAE